jgi:hypothetical protein
MFGFLPAETLIADIDLGSSLTIMDSDSYKDHGGNAKLVRIDG